MLQSIKVDIIYYKTPTDFEMEFNLSGCCRMRLLTDRAPDRKILVNQLVRAVSRSRIIIITGALFGEDGIINTCAKAIGRPTTTLNNRQFGIADDDNIEVIKDSIPLISTDGIFGGCITEQGPQTLILLSENKNIRKNIMQNLIHSYIKELYSADEEQLPQQIELEEELVLDEDDVEEVSENVEELVLEEFEVISEEIPEETLENEIIVSNDPINETDEIRLDDNIAEELVVDDNLKDVQLRKFENDNILAENLFTDIASSKDNYPDEDTFGNEAESYITEDNYENKPKLWTGLNIPIIILIALLLVIIGILCYSIFMVPASEGVTVSEYLKETYDILFA